MTTLLVAANGGHLKQLHELRDRIDRCAGGDVVWATPEDAQSRSLLAGECRIDVPSIAERDLRGVLRLAAIARRHLHRQRFDTVISTGSGIALGFLPVAAARRIPTYFIESATFADRPSVTGRVLERVPGVRLFTQHADCRRRGWAFAGGVLDGFAATPIPPTSARRVVVTLGSDTWSFRRLVDRLVRILPVEAEVTWQVGPTDVGDLDIAPQAYVPAATLEAAIARADVVVAHAGCGSALTALRMGKVPVLVPRAPEHGELIDDHQRPFARSLQARGLAVSREVADLTVEDLRLASGYRVDRCEVGPLRLG